MSDVTMHDVLRTCRDLPCADQVTADAERKLVSFDLGMVAAVSVGLMVTARVVNVMAGLM